MKGLRIQKNIFLWPFNSETKIFILLKTWPSPPRWRSRFLWQMMVPCCQE